MTRVLLHTTQTAQQPLITRKWPTEWLSPSTIFEFCASFRCWRNSNSLIYPQPIYRLLACCIFRNGPAKFISEDCEANSGRWSPKTILLHVICENVGEQWVHARAWRPSRRHWYFFVCVSIALTQEWRYMYIHVTFSNFRQPKHLVTRRQCTLQNYIET